MRFAIGIPPFTDAGATWLVESTEPRGDWLPGFGRRVRAGPG